MKGAPVQILFFVAAIVLGFLLSRAVFGEPVSPLFAALDEVNGFRAAQGEQPLTRDRRLDAAAARHARAMAERDFFGHTGADGSIIGERVGGAGYSWRLVAENIAAGMRDPKRVVETWIDSPGHRRNLLLPGLVHAGLAHVRQDPDPGKIGYRDYWVLVLAAPLEGKAGKAR